jgi:UDP-N-acetylmuramoyl-tripeptide--D-alanyl-D-alanine ligase
MDPQPWTTQDILSATGGDLLCGDLHRRFAGIGIDSRKLAANQLFVAIVGEVHDGHRFTPGVVKHGVRGLMVSRQRTDELPLEAWRSQDVVCVAVSDTTRALGDMAAFNRRRNPAKVVGITGSNGKTSTRAMTVAVLGSCFATLEPAGNYNNQIGLPLTLLNLTPSHQWAVLELGTNTPGEIARLADICTPDIGLITNIGPAHLERLGSLDGVMREKGQLLPRIRAGGQAVLNADDERLLRLAAETRAAVILYGQSPQAGVRALSISEMPQGISFTLQLPEKQQTEVQLNTAARFMVSNALAAAAVGHLLGIPIQAIKAALEHFEPLKGRMKIWPTPAGITLIDDSYNANPSSMNAAILTLQSKAGSRRRVAVLGDMRELGEQSADLHRQVGRVAGAAGLDRLYVFGDFAAQVLAGACEEHLDAGAIVVGSQEDILNDLKVWLRTGDWVLIKGSRAMRMEVIVEGLKEWAITNNR